MFLVDFPRFSLRLDVLRNRKAIFLFASAIAVSYYFCFRTRFFFLWAACCLGINFATNERIIDHFWMLAGSLRRFSLRLDALWKRTAISLRCKNEALNISENYHGSQSLFLFLNSMLSGY